MQSGVHPFVQDGGCDLGLRNIGMHAERQLDQTESGVGEEGAATGEPADEEASQIAPEMTTVMGRILVDEAKRRPEAGQHIGGCDIRTGVLDRDPITGKLVLCGRHARKDEPAPRFLQLRAKQGNRCVLLRCEAAQPDQTGQMGCTREQQQEQVSHSSPGLLSPRGVGQRGGVGAATAAIASAASKSGPDRKPGTLPDRGHDIAHRLEDRNG